jgi:hypothetical protein
MVSQWGSPAWENSKAHFNGSNSRPISLLPCLFERALNMLGTDTNDGWLAETCMSISSGSKLGREWLHHYWSLCEMLMCWRSRTVCLNRLDIHLYHTRYGTRGLFTVFRSSIEAWKHTVLNRAITTCNSLPPQITQASNKIRFKKNR